ncbi:di-heme oxidoredictase family protein [Roseimaritima ulvae]|uniref:Cytochrome c domain-containing protein n=1 Tax=Roseimaritima ulvae TaxID=980254 RepID=A0A5B9R9Q4_9BACT|nr:di-heme oxidoredictase family protein [Roseimaritima ulvae]QEG43751.1 hypothetical protein UC8_58050 [Roseimaritima ulvae]
MRRIFWTAVWGCCGVVLSVLQTPCVATAQSNAIAAREGFTGEQLFRHEWKPAYAPPRSIEAAVPGRIEALARSAGVAGDGLGPLYNAVSCEQCHAGGGASGVEHNVTLISVDPRSMATIDRTRGGKHVREVFPGLLGPTGRLSFNMVVHNHSARPGYAPIRAQLTTFVPGGVDDEWFLPEQRRVAAIARQPVLAGRHESVDFYLSQRNAPALFGIGVIESIGEARIRALAKKQAAKSDGKISGRFVGKFGWRGQVASLPTFIAQACAGELGLTQGVLVERSARIRRASASRDVGAIRPLTLTATQAGDPADFSYVNAGIDMESSEVLKLTRYVASLPRPTEQPPQGYSRRDVLNGEKLFNSIGCVDCHVADLHPISGMFSDLLVHDMGPRLQAPDPAPLGDLLTRRTWEAPTLKENGPAASTSQGYYGFMGSNGLAARLPMPEPIPQPDRPQFPRGDASDAAASSWDALQREWKTPPLWGVADSAPYLHDGRAETLEQAILWHGGEAEASQRGYSELSQPDQDLVIAFLSSLTTTKSTQ